MYLLSPNHKFPKTPKAKWENNLNAIQYLDQLDAGKVRINDEILDTFASYCGLGTIKGVFCPKQKWEKEAQKELQSRLGEEGYRKANASVLNAYYTPPLVADLMWDIVKHCGFSHGNILSVSAGNGMFTMRDGCLNNKWTLIEEEPISASMLKYLYPSAKIYDRGFHRTRLPDTTYDLFIDNVPFGNYFLQDVHLDNNFRVHPHAILRGIQALRPGGLACVVVTSALSDRPTNKPAREAMMKEAEILGVFRLPRETFKEFAGTEVTADILVMRKRAEPLDHEAEMPELDQRFIESRPYKSGVRDRDGSITDKPDLHMNSFVYSNWDKSLLNCEVTLDHLVSGFRLASSSAWKEDYNLRHELELSLRTSIEKGAYRSIGLIEQDFFEEQDAVEGKIIVDYDEGIAYQIKDSNRVAFPEADQDLALMADNLLVATLNVINAQISKSEMIVKPLRKILGKVYDEFVEAHGKLNGRKVSKTLKGCIDLGLLQALETDEGEKAEVFYRSTIRQSLKLKRCKTIQDAYAASLNEMGAVYPANICNLMGSSDLTEIHLDLVQQGLAMYDFDSGQWVEKDSYVGGEVVDRLEVTQRYLQNIDDLDGFTTLQIELETAKTILPLQIELLESVQPLPCMPDCSPEVAVHCATALGIDLEALDDGHRSRLLDNIIEIKFGASWFPAQIYAEFISHLLLPPGANWTAQNLIDNNYVSVTYAGPPIRQYKIFIDDYLLGWGTSDQWRTDDVNFTRMIETLLALKTPRITYKDADEKTHVDAEATAAAQQKAEQIKQEFQSWIWADPARAEMLTVLYNQLFNRTVEHEWDGSHLTAPGMSKDYSPRDYQQNVAWRILRSPGTLMAHSVGLGKTLSMMMSIMEGRRLNLIQKPILSVLKSTLKQIGKEFKAIYPNAKILLADPKSWELKNRRRFLMQAATGDWDCVIMTHEQLVSLNLPVSFAQSYINDELDKIEEIVRGMEPNHRKSDRRMMSSIENRKMRLIAKLDKIMDSQHKKNMSSLHLGNMGFDALYLDESQVAKNLGFTTSQHNVKGVNPGNDSQIAQDINMKCKFFLERGGKVVFSTGTPISNSITELFTLMRHLMPFKLEAMGLDHFDIWATVFTNPTIKPEIASTGVYKIVTRLTEFVNVPEMIKLYRTFADVKTIKHADISRPVRQDFFVEAEPSQEQMEYMQYLLHRAERVEAGKVEPKQDNMLKITSDGKANSLDPREVDKGAENDLDSKLNKCILNVFKIWDMTTPVLATQAIFCDMSTPNPFEIKLKDAEGNVYEKQKRKMFNVYDYIRETLVEMGITRDEIAFIHEHDSLNKKQKLFDRINKGEVRIVLGSTKKLGTGVNIQSRLIAMHHIDAPYRPSDLQQRDGRGERYGNMWSDILIFTYVTQGYNNIAGFDSYLFQLLQNKAKMYGQLAHDNVTCRTIKDDTGLTLKLSEIKALASGNPHIQRKADLESTVQQLSMAERAHSKRQVQLVSKKNKNEALIRNIPGQIDALIENLTLFDQEITQDNFHISYREKNKTIELEGIEAFEAIYGLHAKINAKLSSSAFSYDIKLNNGPSLVMESSMFLGGGERYISLPNSDEVFKLRIVKDFSQLLTRINNIGHHIEDRITGLRNKLSKAHEQIKNFNASGTFPQAKELSDAVAELAAIDIQLNLEADRHREQRKLEAGAEIEVNGTAIPEAPTWSVEPGRQEHSAVFITPHQLNGLIERLPEFDGPWFDLIRNQMKVPVADEPQTPTNIVPMTSSRRRRGQVTA